MSSEAVSTYELVGLVISAVTALGVAGGGFKFWVNAATKISDSNSAAKHSLQEAAEANATAKSAHDRITVQAEAFGLYRERVARDYVSRDILREMEERISATIRDSAKVSSDALNNLSSRIDKMNSAGG